MKKLLGVAVVVGLGVSLIAADTGAARGPRGRGPGGPGGGAARRTTGGGASRAGASRAGAAARNRLPGPKASGAMGGPRPARSFGASGFNRPTGPIRANGSFSAATGNLSTAFNAAAGGSSPFSPAWYAQHPNAWQATHPYAGPAAVAVTAVGVAQWLAVGSGGTTVVQGEAQYAEPADGESTIADESLPVATDDDGRQWLPIGVYSLHPANQPAATRVMQLSVGRDGRLRGSHFDLITNATVDIQGNVDGSGEQASWTIGSGGQVIFQTSLQQLTRPVGRVTVRYPDGQTGQWQISRLEN